MLKKFVTWKGFPFWVFHLPIVPYIIYLALRSRSLLFFTACNPIIHHNHSGQRPSKNFILSHLDPKYLPKNITVERGQLIDEVSRQLSEADLDYPLVAKPDRGERGVGVVKVECAEELAAYLRETTENVLIQEWIDWPIEMGVLYCRYPNQERGRVTSLSTKRLPTVIGDGQSTAWELAQRDRTMRRYLKRIRGLHGEELDRVLAKGESFILDYVGQQTRGTQFLDASIHNTDAVAEHFDRICKPIPEFYCGRFDLKVASPEDLVTGEHLKVLEINGTASMPIHIFDPEIDTFTAYREMYRHWRNIYEISKQNRSAGAATMSFRDALSFCKVRFSHVPTDDLPQRRRSLGAG
jgi:hypothetical protein